jgi:hypothetical protein
MLAEPLQWFMVLTTARAGLFGFAMPGREEGTETGCGNPVKGIAQPNMLPPDFD